MKLAIIGGRDFLDYDLLCSELEPYINKVTLVVSGAAPGADSLGARWSREILGKEPLEFEALWDDLTKQPCKVKYKKNGKPYNALAGFNRNEDIIKNCDGCIAFFDGYSKGTSHSISLCKKYKKPLKIIYY